MRKKKEPDTEQEATDATPPLLMERGIHDAVLEVMQQAAWVSKTGKNSHMRYDYASEVDIISVYRPAMVKAGIFIRPLSIDIIDRVMAGKNHRIIAKLVYRLEGGNGIVGHIDIPVISEGVDTQDKAAAKVYTQGLKIAMLQTFCIPRGEDPDADNVEPYDPRSDFREWAEANGGWQKVVDFALEKKLSAPGEWTAAWIERYKRTQAG